MSFKFDWDTPGILPLKQADLLPLRHKKCARKVTMRCSTWMTQEDVLAEVVLED